VRIAGKIMEENIVIARLEGVFRDTLDLEDLMLSRKTVAGDVEGWDSLAHVRLMIATEREFGCRFNSADISKLKNVGELIDLVKRSSANT
jgi:acyl carrier protein